MSSTLEEVINYMDAHGVGIFFRLLFASLKKGNNNSPNVSNDVEVLTPAPQAATLHPECGP
jgi:hypothetical protein